ncbi:ABC transporter permease subunit [Verrucomicrobiaceae bacterium R5-34]|uniref:ABC transporter permease subunit n=1 Tax=Oceaniferula flava TaxID=2800421 RepID=A0AAE2SAP9_9BACT|nr:ABC transporter permease subunit [Oceaniferula flavus]MBK1829250.1 ABC transporter permease subunit [Verrucomicrobiaceae bacterium R5-34]MBK1853487.1 ABC transporter permease subunit [Oceaniferula flavus]MBM1134792.1 ABC transporter permease subunit [Oceaniferula flavus]
MFRKIGWLLILGAILSAAGELLLLKLPTLRWSFDVSREMDWLNWGSGDRPFLWFGWLSVLVFLICGILLLLKFPRDFQFTPITQRRIDRFKSIKRGHRAFVIVGFLALIASLDHLLVGNEALLMKYNGQFYSPALQRFYQSSADEDVIFKGKHFGLTGDQAEAAPNYRKLKKVFKEEQKGDWLVMPLVPYAPTQDTVTTPTMALETRDDGLLYKPGSLSPYSGLASKIYDINEPNRIHLRYRFRDGQKDGAADGWDRKNNRIYGAEYSEGKLVSESWSGEGDKAKFLNTSSSDLSVIYYAPSPPSLTMGHLLGTTPQGYDVLAYLYGGLQVNFKASIFFIPAIYLIGISVGLLMGFFGGIFDLFVQRLIEIFSNIPFLFVIIIVSASVPVQIKEKSGLGVILLILIIFSWMGMTYLMRTAALKEKARDYVAASRIIGCSTPRILFKHILPNAVAILVTLVPFSVSGLVMGLTSLDYLGFGLPPKYATWGTLLKDGLSNLSAPWLVSSAFFCLVSLLILVTFIGEAVREAFDPKKFTYYK